MGRRANPKHGRWWDPPTPRYDDVGGVRVRIDRLTAEALAEAERVSRDRCVLWWLRFNHWFYRRRDAGRPIDAES